jgi:hypothetical protein
MVITTLVDFDALMRTSHVLWREFIDRLLHDERGAITTIGGIIAGMIPPRDYLKVGVTMKAAGVMHSHFYSPGLPGAAVAPTPGLAGAALTSYLGQIPWTNPASGNSYLARFSVRSNLVGVMFLLDRLWHNSGIVVTTTTAQTINSVEFPARDRDGAVNGENILVAIEVSTATTNASAITNTTMSYTNSQGVSGRTATIPSFPATAVAGSFVPFLLQAGDTGIKSIQSITLGTSYGGGAIHLVAYRILAQVGISVAYISGEVDAITSGFPRLYNNTVPFLVWLPSATTAVTVAGQMIVTQG